MKTEHPDDDAIIDDTAGQAYVEQFAQQTFDRCEKVLQANKVTRFALSNNICARRRANVRPLGKPRIHSMPPRPFSSS